MHNANLVCTSSTLWSSRTWPTLAALIFRIYQMCRQQDYRNDKSLGPLSLSCNAMLRNTHRMRGLRQFSGKVQRSVLLQTAGSRYHSSRVATATVQQNPVTSLSYRNDAQFPPSSTEDKPQVHPWQGTGSEALDAENISALFKNKLSSIGVPNVLTVDESSRLVDIITTHKIECYGSEVYPPIGSVGITQFRHRQDKDAYFAGVQDALNLQKRFMAEAKIDIVDRVRQALQLATNIPVRIAREDNKEYFAGLLRLVNSSALIHADYGPFDGPSWEIGRISAQLSWNILLREVKGGECIIYDRLWRGSEDDNTFKQPAPSYGYMPSVVRGRKWKTVKPRVGELTLFNSRNFHEVRAIEQSEEYPRYTLSSFIGLLPKGTDGKGPEIILWS